MSASRKCKNCGSSDIEVDPARGDAVCTNCGSVLEDNIIVAEVQFEEGANGTANTIGQFVSSDSKGGATSFGNAFHVSRGMSCIESREITLNKARNGISQLCNQLRLNAHCIDTAFNFFKMALSRNLTRRRKNAHVYAACVYLTCRTEGTAHMLIDISDVLQICCYELGRTYLRLSQALCINVPSMDPCLYILRFAAKLEFGAKTQEVANTALRLVQRMKRDSIHSGRRPSGLCGAALLIAARLHEFNRSPGDIIRIVKVHESTLRKRLVEFGDTPSSSLTLDEFMTVDLEEEQDPPSFKAARKKDKERLQRLIEDEGDHITELQKDIERQLESDSNRKRKRPSLMASTEDSEITKYIEETTLGAVNEVIENIGDTGTTSEPTELGPDIASMGLACSLDDVVANPTVNQAIEIDITFDDIDDKELDSYIMTEDEYKSKNGIWHRLNADYLDQLKRKEEKLAKEREEGKPEKRKRKRKTNIGPANSAGEAIEKMLQEKKISSKINYEVLRSLTTTTATTKTNGSDDNKDTVIKESPSILIDSSGDTQGDITSKGRRGRIKRPVTIGLPVVENEKTPVKSVQKPEKDASKNDISHEDEDYEDFEEDHVEDTKVDDSEMDMYQMLRQHRDDGDETDALFSTGYEEEDY
ncbi:transcription factor IIIB 90 kDa subunit isoform X2 [Onthophagus taurus]|uniref:transcription factor IIIB 90 kDa subunit isoform X2 n=1 Tax=Onthophagus taurus TaxID=166361 RepID=UPI000C2062D1|nr:transcription factor IIIB 90 kDa subunit isoform X2 [Onthophagus taurus]